MKDIFKNLEDFISRCPSNIPKTTKDAWKSKVVKKVVDQYITSVNKTLSSVKAIEDSLRRYKKSKSTEGVSDEYKIRYQFKLDYDQFILEVFCLDKRCNKFVAILLKN
jgi:hypothetical protein